jgi:hypothetical protein
VTFSPRRRETAQVSWSSVPRAQKFAVTHAEIHSKVSSDVTPGVFLALLLIVGIFAVYSGGIWLLVSAESPLHQRRRRSAVDRTVLRETHDLDRKFADLMKSMRHRD